MTLLYWWMHWFWITAGIHFVNSDGTTLHSVLNDQTNFSELAHNLAPTKTINRISLNKNPPIIISPFNSSVQHDHQQQQPYNLTTKYYNNNKSKPTTLKKFDFIYSNSTMQSNMTLLNTTITTTTTTTIKNSKESTVINQNLITTTDVSSTNTTDNQLIITSIGAIINNNNHTTVNDNNNLTTYLGEEDTEFNESLILNSERISIENENEFNQTNLSAAGITGITLGCVIIVGVICGVSYFLYRNRGFNRPQVLNDRFSNPDSSGYIDDASVRDNSEEMYSLDNDSFLNSLEAMTIQNYWTDTVKHTKL